MAVPTAAALLLRFRRVEGQVRGLQKMVEDGRDGVELLTQIASVREALRSAAAVILRTHLAESAAAAASTESVDERKRISEITLKVFRKWAT